MSRNLIAHANVDIDAPRDEVWNALVDPDAIREYMFGTNVVSDWRQGSPIRWSGEWQGKRYEDKGEVLQIDRGRRLQYSHFSPLTGEPDRPESYHTVTIELTDNGGRTRVALTQDKNPTEEARNESEKNWRMMLGGLKKYVEP